MTERIPQSTSKVVLFKAYLASDHVSEATGKTIAITISKNGGAFGNPNAGATNATEISSGWYKVTLDTTDTGTLGPIALRGAAATIDDVGVLLEVVSATSGGYTNLDAAVSGRMATYTQPTGFLAATFPSGTVANTTNIAAGTITTVTNLTNAPTAGDLTAAMKTSVTTAATAATPTAAAVTGNVGGNVTGSIGSLAAQAKADVNAEADTALADAGVTTTVTGRIDVATSTRLAAAGYTAPDNGTIAAIDAKTANLPSDPADESLIIAATNAIIAAIAALNNLSAAQVNAEVVDALSVDTYAEPSGVPAATASIVAKLGRIHQALRNGLDVTAGAKTFKDDAGSALWKKALSDDGTTYAEGEAEAA